MNWDIENLYRLYWIIVTEDYKLYVNLGLVIILFIVIILNYINWLYYMKLHELIFIILNYHTKKNKKQNQILKL